jgi:hypothetical protein
MSTHYFSCSGGPGTHYAELVFLHLAGFGGHVVHSGAPGARNVETLFFILRWNRHEIHKKRVRTSYAKTEFLHPVGIVGHIVHKGASEFRNIDALFSCLSGTNTDSTNSALGHITSNLCFFNRCNLWVTYCILVCPGRETMTHYFSCSGGPDAYSIKCTPGHLTLNSCFCIQ